LPHRNKLNTPLAEGAVPSGDQVEIVEDFNDESHNKWMTEHRERVRQQKQQERLKRQAEPPGTGDEVLKKLEEREMMEELGLDPDNVNEEQLQDLLNEDQAPQEASNENGTLTPEKEAELWKKLEAEEQNEAGELSPEAEESLKSTDDLVRRLMSGATGLTLSFCPLPGTLFGAQTTFEQPFARPAQIRAHS